MDGTAMIVTRVRGVCDDGKTCPALHLTDRDTAVIQGWAVDDAEVLAQLGLPAGSGAVEVPSALLAEVLHCWPALRRTSWGTVIVPGIVVSDPDALMQLCLPPGERAVEVPAGSLAGVLQAC
jgi:hypothetical protein